MNIFHGGFNRNIFSQPAPARFEQTNGADGNIAGCGGLCSLLKCALKTRDNRIFPTRTMCNRLVCPRNGAPASKIASGLFVAILLCLVSRQTLQAYVLEGPKWPVDSVVTFQLSLGDAGRTLIDGNTSWNTGAAPAFGLWDQSIQHVQFVGHEASSAAAPNDHVNTIAFSSTVFGQAFGSNTLAVTYYDYSSSVMTEADVLFNRNQTFDSYRGSLRYGSNGYAIADIRRVLVHELGHALGLDHPDQNGQQVDAIMNSVMSDRETPSADDLAGAQSLYGARKPVTPVIRSVSRMANGHILLQCSGAPNAANRIEVSSNFSQGFTTLTSVTAGSTGQFQFEDDDAGSLETRFYRVAYP